MAEQDATEIRKPPRPRRRGRLGFWMLIGPAALLIGLGIAWLAFTGRPVVLPDWATARVERALAARTGTLGVDVGGIEVEVNRGGLTRVVLRNLELSGPDGASVGQFNTLSAGLLSGALLEGAIRPASLSIEGAQLTVRRATDGSFGIRLGDGVEAMGDLAGLLDRIDAIFASDGFSSIGRIAASDLTLTLEDARSGRLWQATGGEIEVRNGEDNVEIQLISELFDGTDTLPGIQLSFDLAKASRAAILNARLTDLPARDIAAQAPALAFLGALEARVSGALRTVVSGGGTVESLDGTLEIAEGALRPTEAAEPVAFNRGRSYFSYDPGRQKIAFSEISVESDTLRASGTGHAYLRDFSGPWPATLMAQVRMTELDLAPEGLFGDAVAFDAGIADFRLRIDPFEVDFGQVVLLEEDTRVDGHGSVRVGADGWHGAFDLSAPVLTPERLLSLWPLELGPKTRTWLDENLAAGRLLGVDGAVRLEPGTRPRFGFTFDYEEAEVRFLPEMPPVTGGRGHAALDGAAFTITVNEGTVTPDGGAPVDVEHASFGIDDVFAKPGNATLFLKTSSALHDVLLVMDNPPFRVLSKAEFDPGALSADAELSVEAHFPLKKDLPVEEVRFDVSGTLREIRSESLVHGHVLSADALDLKVVPGLLTVAGPVRLDDLPLDVTLSQPLDRPDAPGRIDGQVELSQRLLDTLGIALPEDMVSGRGTGALTLGLGAVPDFTLRSDLLGLRVALPALGWTKPPADTGSLEIAGRLGAAPEIDRLVLEGDGLSAVGRLTLGEGGAFQAAEFERVTAGSWFDAPVRIEARGEGLAPAIALTGGTIDLRSSPDGDGGGGDPTPLSIRLDRLQVSDGIALTGFSADLVEAGGLDGTFTGAVNGGARVSGTMVPQRGKTALRVRGDDAGAILRSAGVFRSLDEGSFDLILAPRAGAEGFDGQIEILNARLGDQPAMINMLDAVSVVGLIDQLRGPGVYFDTIQGRFRLTGDRLTLTQGSAVGASLGVSLDGIYDIAGKRLDMQGVMSPIYLLNSVGQVFTRRGEGLFGFTFRLTGAAGNPSVSVNPLSFLTPGAFREIFRRPVPQ